MRYLTPAIMLAAGIATTAAIPTPTLAADQYSIAVGTLGGTMGRLGAGLADVVNKNQTDMKLSVTPGGGRANPARVSTGGADFGYSFTNFTATALAGKAPFDKKYPNLRVVARFITPVTTSMWARTFTIPAFSPGKTSWPPKKRSR